MPEVQALLGYLNASDAGERASIEPGADELGMALVANVLARDARWRPHIAVHYSTPQGALYQDPLEYAPIGVTIASALRAHKAEGKNYAAFVPDVLT